MTSSEAGRSESRRTRRGASLVAGAGLAGLAVAVAAVYLARDGIADRFAAGWLDRHGITSGLDVRGLSLTGLTASLRIGRASDPDLAIDRLDVGYTLLGPWNGQALGLRVDRLHLVRPRVKLRLTEAGLNFGAIQPLIDEIAKLPSGGPLPDVTVEDGAVLVLTPDGRVRLHGDGALKAGVLTQLSGELDPFQASFHGVHLKGAGGTLRVARLGQRLSATIKLGPASGANPDAKLAADQVLLSGELPYPAQDGHWAGPTRLALVARGVSGTVGAARTAGGELNADLDGALTANPARQAVVGRLSISGQLAKFTQQNGSGRDATVRLDLAHLALSREATGVTLVGEGSARAMVGAVKVGGGEFSTLAGSARVGSLRLVSRNGRMSGSAILDGGVAGNGAFANIASLAAGPASDTSYAKVAGRALRSFRFAAAHWRAEVSDAGARVNLDSPALVDADSGAHLSLSILAGGLSLGPNGARGGGDLAIGGGGLPALRVRLTNGVISRSGFQAEIAARGSLDTQAARDVRFQLNGRLAGAGPRFRFDLTSCAPQSALRLGADPNTVTGFAANLCPSDGPLVEFGPGGWTSLGKLDHVQGDIAGVNASVRGASAKFQAHGRGALDTAALVLDRGEIIDTTDSIRFRPLILAGRAGLSGGAWTGEFTAATRAGRPIGTVRLRDDVATGAGRADIALGALEFAAGGLQPADLSPLVSFARQADGSVSFTGWFAWNSGGQMRSGGELDAKALKFKSPLGEVRGIDTDVHFVSLAPPVTEPAQTISIGLVDAVVPLSSLSARFSLGAHSIIVESASGVVAKGHVRLEPMVAPLAAGSKLTGVLVLDHVDLGEIIAASSLASAIQMRAVADGRIPFQVGPSGLTIQQGRLAAVGPGRLSISRAALTGAASAGSSSPATTASGQAAFAQDLAYQAMENLAFDQLDASLNSQPKDRLGILFHVKGRHDPPTRQRAVIGVKDLLRGQALAKPITLPSDTQINLTLDTSLNFGELMGALSQAWRDSVGGGPSGSPSVQIKKASVTAK